MLLVGQNKRVLVILPCLQISPLNLNEDVVSDRSDRPEPENIGSLKTNFEETVLEAAIAVEEKHHPAH